MISQRALLTISALLLSWLTWLPSASAQVTITLGSGKYDYTYDNERVGHSYRSRTQDGGWWYTNDFNSKYNQKTSIDEGMRLFLEDWVTYTPEYSSHTGSDSHYTEVTHGSNNYTASMSEDVNTTIDTFSDHKGEMTEGYTINTIEQHPAPEGLENPRTVTDPIIVDGGARTVFPRTNMFGTAWACKTNYKTTAPFRDADNDRDEENTYKGSESYHQKFIIDGEVPEGKVAYLNYSLTYYDYYFYPEVRYFNYSTGRREYHLKLDSLGGERPIIDPARMLVFDNSCRVLTVTNYEIVFEDKPGSPQFVAAAATAPAAPMFDMVAGIFIFETNYLNKTPHPPQAYLQARAVSRRLAARDYYQNVIRPNFLRTSTLIRNWYFSVIRELFQIFAAMARGEQFRMPSACRGYTDLGRCLTENMNPRTSPVLRPAATPTPTPSVRY